MARPTSRLTTSLSAVAVAVAVAVSVILPAAAAGRGDILRRAMYSSSRALPTALLLVEVQRAGALNYKPQAAAGVFLAQLRLLVAVAAAALVTQMLRAADQAAAAAT